MNRRDVFKEIEDMGYFHSISFTNGINIFVKNELEIKYLRPDSDEGDHIIVLKVMGKSDSSIQSSFESVGQVKEIITRAERELTEKN